MFSDVHYCCKKCLTLRACGQPAAVCSGRCRVYQSSMDTARDRLAVLAGQLLNDGESKYCSAAACSGKRPAKRQQPRYCCASTAVCALQRRVLASLCVRAHQQLVIRAGTLVLSLRPPQQQSSQHLCQMRWHLIHCCLQRRGTFAGGSAASWWVQLWRHGRVKCCFKRQHAVAVARAACQWLFLAWPGMQ
jgi:hypothetical protein